jgi:gas vesicle protein
MTIDRKKVPAALSFGAGVLVGGALGLLLAPRSGLELRYDLADKLEQLKNRFKKAEADMAGAAGSTAGAAASATGPHPPNGSAQATS